MTDRFGYGEIGLDINPRHPCEGCRDYEAPDGCKSNGGCGKPMTNGDNLRAMTDEELAILCEDGCPPGAPICNSVETIEGETVKEHCQRCWLSWLKATVEEKQT